jgi:regulator of Ty1 transposition protein 103
VILSLLVADDPRREPLCTKLKNEEDSMKKCIEKLKLVEENRAAVVSELKEALQDQVRTTVISVK